MRNPDMSYQFATTPTLSNLYIAHTVNNIDLIMILNKKKGLDKEILQDNSKTRNCSRYPTLTLEYYQASRYNEQSTSKYKN